MNRSIFIIAVLVAGMLTANAQMFVGGGIGVDFTGGKNKMSGTTTDRPSTFAFEFTPKVGYYLNDDFAIGLQVGLSTWSETTPGATERVDSEFGWAVDAFARYNLLGTERLSLLLEGSVGYGGISSKTKTGSTSTDLNPETFFSIGIVPVLTYDLTSRLSLEASSDFLRLGFMSTTEKEASNKDIKYVDNDFGFGVNSGWGTLLNLGLIFKF